MSDPYDRYLDEFGEQLAAAGDRPSSRLRRSPSTRALAIGGLALGVCLAVLALVSGGSASRRLDIVAEARAALAPAGEVVHLRIRTGSSRAGLQPILSRTTDQWTAVAPPRWRVVQTIGTGVRVADRLGRRVRGREEFSYADGVQRQYLAERDELTRTEGFSDTGPAAKVPSPLGGDPATDLRALLADGEVRDAGLRIVGGHEIRRLVVDRERSSKLRVSLTYDVDPTTFAPVRGVLRTRLALPQVTGRRHVPVLENAVTFTVTAYERIPLNATSARLLEIATTPRTKVTRITGAQRRRREATAARECRRTFGGATACPLRVPRP